MKHGRRAKHGNPAEQRATNMTPAYKPERARQQGSVHRIPAEFVTRLRLMLIWEARLQAREIVKRKLKAEGVRVSLLSASTITRHADKYLRTRSCIDH
jgi:hypothetical protein